MNPRLAPKPRRVARTSPKDPEFERKRRRAPAGTPQGGRFVETPDAPKEAPKQRIRKVSEVAPKPQKENKAQAWVRMRNEWLARQKERNSEFGATILPARETITPKEEANITKRLQKLGITSETMQASIEEVYKNAFKPQPIASGKRKGQMETEAEAKTRVETWKKWYPYANAYALNMSEKFKTGRDQSIGIIAALSPQLAWDTNLIAAHDAMYLLSKDPIVTIDKDIAKKVKKFSKGKINLQSYSGVDKNFKRGQSFEGKFALSKLPYDVVPFVAPVYNRRTSKQVSAIRNPDEVPLPGVRAREIYFKSGVGAASLNKVVRIWRGESVDEVLGGSKVRSFFDNIKDPYYNEVKHFAKVLPVTVDVHATRILVGFDKPDTEAQGMLRGGSYIYSAQQYAKVAERLRLLPNELQAITWMQWRRQHPPVSRRKQTVARKEDE